MNKSEVRKIENKKMGRPTTNPKNEELKLRISKEDKEEVTEEIVVEKKQISLSEIDDKLSNIDSIIKDINE